MKTTTTLIQMTLRASGLLLLVLGLAIWTGHDQLTQIHELLGLVLVLSLWALAFFAARARVSTGLVMLAAAWGLGAAILGIVQGQLLTGDWHWTIQVLHLLIGLGAIGQGEILGNRMRRIAEPEV